MLAAVLVVTMSMCLLLGPLSTHASPAASAGSSHFPRALNLLDKGSRADVNGAQTQSLHMRVADRLLKRVLDLTYETLKDLGASEEDLNTVQHKRSYIQTCYFHAVSCY